MSERKVNKLIIPKIKTSSSPSPNNAFKRGTPELKPKNDPSYFSQLPEYQASHIKNFPKEEDREKMTQKELAQTYFEQFKRLNRENQVLDKQLAFVRQERDILAKKYNELKEQQKYSEDQRPKRQRRVATDIDRNYNCPAGNCDRSYGSEGSLIQHIKIKHQQYYGSQEYNSFLNKRKEDSDRNE